MTTIKGDSLPEKLFSLAKRGAFVNYQERELIKQAAMKIQTLQAERALAREPAAPRTQHGADWEMGNAWWYVCGACSGAIDKGDAYCRRCGKKVKWDA